MSNLMEKIVSLSKRRGLVYPSSEIYGGLAGIYEFGPLGVELLRNIKNLWWQDMIHRRDDVYGLDGSILMHPESWEASGHVAGFSDPLVECRNCRKRIRPDKLKGWQLKKNNRTGQWQVLKQGSLECIFCRGKINPKIRQFNVLMETSLGVIEGEKMKVYLKGESCQNIYLDYHHVVDSFSPEIPFGLAQIGKAFRNEITLGRFLFKTREFEQYDIEYFVKPEDSAKYYQEWKKIRWDWYVKRVGIKEKNLRWRQHSKDERIFYAKDAWDIDYRYPWGFDELEGLHDRSDYDLTQQSKFSGQKLDYLDKKTGKRFVPHIIECSGGLGRTFFAALTDAYQEKKEEKDTRVFLALNPRLAPYKMAVFPLVANKPKLVKAARKIYEELKKKYVVAWDDIGNIGKRYRRQDEIATPYCLTIDYQTLKDKTVTVRERDTMKQKRIGVDKLSSFFQTKLEA